MGECGGNGGEAEAMRDDEEHAQVDPPLLLVGRDVEPELVIHDCPDVVKTAHRRCRSRSDKKTGNFLAPWRSSPQYATGIAT